jgi:hypothetical protein
MTVTEFNSLSKKVAQDDELRARVMQQVSSVFLCHQEKGVFLKSGASWSVVGVGWVTRGGGGWGGGVMESNSQKGSVSKVAGKRRCRRYLLPRIWSRMNSNNSPPPSSVNISTIAFVHRRLLVNQTNTKQGLLFSGGG